MSDVQYKTKFTDLPDVLPVFPLEGVLLLPGGQLPLNIFEDRYIAMIDDALASNRMIGIIQPKPDHVLQSGIRDLQTVGCMGKITQFNHLPDDRYTVLLRGMWRFDIKEELSQRNGYRQVMPIWSAYAGDITIPTCLGIDRDKLCALMKIYLEKNNLEVDCAQFENTGDTQLITALSMICPLPPIDKQALLEAPCCKTRAEMFMAILEMAVHGEKTQIIH